MVFFSIYGDSHNVPDEGRITRVTIGFQPSPWFVYERSAKGFKFDVPWINASWLFAAAAIGAFKLLGRIPSPPPKTPSKENT